MNSVLIFAKEIGASDIHIQGGDKIKVTIENKIYPITRNYLTGSNFEDFMSVLYGKNGITELLRGEPKDDSYFIRKENGEVLRFRYNGIGIQDSDAFETGAISIRTMSQLPGDYSDYGFEEELYTSFKASDGMIIVTGVTGSGKTTFVTSSIQRLLKEDKYRKIATYEDPIEYDLTPLKSDHNIIQQTPVPSRVKTYSLAIQYAMRRKINVMLFGEIRAGDVAENAIQASLTGHLVLTTMHTKNVKGTILRLLAFFPSSSRDGLLIDLKQIFRLLVTQKLIEGVDGRLIGVREYCLFDSDFWDSLEVFTVDSLLAHVECKMEERGTRMIDKLTRLHSQGLISDEVFLKEKKLIQNV
ncbi:ATPase, T2SS/T4P/T4SS family [Photobacterium leiognathi]|uniref:ATPase, T2SS/T4P/T4SS family n=1 Tax=Photobacterium leiognathi TaxID=553611 RepID=UPI00298238B2|nr:ATPase, T2SS/T4P/T4SS family [Photobacterium leiognathi]